MQGKAVANRTKSQWQTPKNEETMNMNDPGNTTFLDQLITNVVQTRFEDIEKGTIKHAKNRILDTLGCLIGGANDAGNSQLYDLIRTWGGRQEATILVHGVKVPAHNAAMMNAIMARSFDFEPVSPYVDGVSVPGHITGTTLMVALALSEIQDITGKEFLTALLVGDDLSARVSILGSGPSTFSGRDRVGPINLFGSTAIAGRILKLDSIQLRNALGLLLAYLGGSHQLIYDTTTAYKLSQGTSARDSIISAQMARAGWTGAKDALFSDFGYYNVFSAGVRDPEIVTKNLGQEYYSDSTFKPYPCCRLNHSAIDCALALVQKYEIQINDIDEIIIQVAPPVLEDILSKPFEIGDFPHASAIFSIQYNVANVLLRKSSVPKDFTEEAIRDPKIMILVGKMKMTALTEGEAESARVSIRLRDGQNISEFTEIARGDPRRPLSEDELLTKYWNNVEFGGMLKRENAEKIIEMIENLEKLDSILDLIQLIKTD
ncbi:MAG: MmgE/PrpD family protein [Dehalococcoidales bacterium]|nr:MmgE/PrpD family protein [Dehalococcoidales bacterium]